MRAFYLVRLEDESGVSGTGLVAEGVQFDDGRCVMKWVAPKTPSSIALYDSADDLIAIHGHSGKTRLSWGHEV